MTSCHRVLTAAEWNQQVQVGQVVGLLTGSLVTWVTTKTQAFIDKDGHAVVAIVGRPGALAIGQLLIPDSEQNREI